MLEPNAKLRVLQVHDSYSPGWGGEDTVVELEACLLRERGHAVEQFRSSHAALKNAGILRQLLAAPGFLWSRQAYGALTRRISAFRPDVVHVHNTFPQLSPSVFWAANRAGVPVIQTLHNFRHICANSMLLRGGSPCEYCVGLPPWPALRYGCYSGSRARTATVVAINLVHAKLGTYRRHVDACIVLNELSREIFRRAGFPEERLFIKPNFVPLSPAADEPRKRQAVFVGSIRRSKGIPLLLQAWTGAELAKSKLLVIGDGPEKESLMRQYRHLPEIEWCGKLDRSEVLRRIAASRVLVFPSLAYENCPMVVLEALSVGTPVVAADHPGLQAIVRHKREGLLFRAGSVQSLTFALQAALHSTGGTWSAWSCAARQAHAERYSETANYRQLLSIYQTVIARRSARVALPAKPTRQLAQSF
jgi:glycosyltransferase involved in cell wall biosynthesis